MPVSLHPFAPAAFGSSTIFCNIYQTKRTAYKPLVHYFAQQKVEKTLPMEEQCCFVGPVPLLREHPDLSIDSPEIFCKVPPFRADLVVSPNGSEWLRIANGMHVSGECVVHPRQRTSYRNSKHQTRRLFYEWFVAALKKSQQVTTICKNKECVYPPHLKAETKVSHGDGVYKMWKNGGEKGMLSQKQRAEKYGIPIWVVKRRDQGKIFKYLPYPADEAHPKATSCLEVPKEVLIFKFPSET
jgi:hypothetical protein